MIKIHLHSLLTLGALLGLLCTFGMACRSGGIFKDHRASDCGELGEACCDKTTPTCDTGLGCGSEGTCCASIFGASCTENSDCCGNTECSENICCKARGTQCHTSSECCTGDICGADGTCQATPSSCGDVGQGCCTGDRCEQGRECLGSACGVCGTEGERCCKGAYPCKGGLVCGNNTCSEPASNCGEEGETCCAGNSCAIPLQCDAQSNTCTQASADCEATDCGSCTANILGLCGWCENGDQSACLPADGSGSNTECAEGTWSPALSQCPSAPDIDPCNTATTCGACTDTTGLCGWCGDTNTCISGNAGGAYYQACNQWEFYRSQCNAGASTAACGELTDCGSCLNNPWDQCGWCNGTGCLEGNSSGATSGTSCAANDWWWGEASQCPGSILCGELTPQGCGTCTHQFQCAWCTDGSGSCISGDANGANDPCNSWISHPTQCSP